MNHQEDSSPSGRRLCSYKLWKSSVLEEPRGMWCFVICELGSGPGAATFSLDLDFFSILCDSARSASTWSLQIRLKHYDFPILRSEPCLLRLRQPLAKEVKKIIRLIMEEVFSRAARQHPRLLIIDLSASALGVTEPEYLQNVLIT